MKIKSLMIAGMIGIMSVSAFAKAPYGQKFKAAYPSAAATLQKCTLCHIGTGFKERNDFGRDYAANNYDFKAIEAFDSDVDGFTNLQEITGGTLPGNVDSHPAN